MSQKRKRQGGKEKRRQMLREGKERKEKDSEK